MNGYHETAKRCSTASKCRLSLTAPDMKLRGVQLLHLLQQLKAAGMFVVVALAQPFGFEGARRMDAAEALTHSVASAADLAVIVQQVRQCMFYLYIACLLYRWTHQS